MALDFADKLAANADIVLVHSDKYRAYNLLQNSAVFVDNEGIGLDIADMVHKGIDDDQIESIITQYLVDFSCNLQDIIVRSDKGNISIKYNFTSGFKN